MIIDVTANLRKSFWLESINIKQVSKKDFELMSPARYHLVQNKDRLSIADRTKSKVETAHSLLGSNLDTLIIKLENKGLSREDILDKILDVITVNSIKRSESLSELGYLLDIAKAHSNNMFTDKLSVLVAYLVSDPKLIILDCELNYYIEVNSFTLKKLFKDIAVEDPLFVQGYYTVGMVQGVYIAVSARDLIIEDISLDAIGYGYVKLKEEDTTEYIQFVATLNSEPTKEFYQVTDNVNNKDYCAVGYDSLKKLLENIAPSTDLAQVRLDKYVDCDIYDMLSDIGYMKGDQVYLAYGVCVTIIRVNYNGNLIVSTSMSKTLYEVSPLDIIPKLQIHDKDIKDIKLKVGNMSSLLNNTTLRVAKLEDDLDKVTLRAYTIEKAITAMSWDILRLNARVFNVTGANTDLRSEVIRLSGHN